MARLGVGIELVGRRPEVAALESALERAAAGHPSGVLLSGDAGVGKTRMVAEAVERAVAAGFTVLVGRCLDTADAALPYLPFTEIVGSLVATHPDLLAEHEALRHLLPGGVERSGATGEDRALGQLRVFDAVLTALDALSAAAPALLVVEDLHWADRSSRDLLVFLLSRLTSQRLVVLATYRRDDLNRRHPLRPVLAELVRLPAIERLELEPLGSAESLELVRALADGSFDEGKLHRVARRSEGNAFYAEELVTSRSEAIPHGLADMLMGRIEALPATTQRVLRIAAVSGRRVRHDRLAAVSGLPDDELEQALRDAAANHVLVATPSSAEGDSYTFRHALLREAIYHELLPGERTRLHARYAQLLAEHDVPGTAAELAHHALAGHDLPRALAASVVASREANDREAPAEMLLHAERALELWSAVPDPERVAGVDEVTVTRWAADGSSSTGDPDRAAALGRRALDLAESRGDPILTSRLARGWAQLLLDLPGREKEAFDAARRALELLTDGPPNQIAWAHAILGRVYWRIDRPGDAAEQARAAIATADSVPDDHMAVGAKADALVTLSVAEGRAGHPDRARDLLAEARPLARRTGYLVVELRTHFNTGMSLLDDARLGEAAAAFAAGEARAREVGFTWSGYGIDMRVAHVITKFMRGDWDRAEDAAELVGESVSASVASRLASAGLLVATARGRFDAVERRLAELRDARSADEQVIILTGQAGIEAARWAGRPEQAAARATEAIEELDALYPLQIGVILLAALGAGAHADLGTSGRVPLPEAVAAAERLAELARDTAERGIPRGNTLGPEGLAWVAGARAEVSRLTGGDPAAWSEVVEGFSYEQGAAPVPGYRQSYALMRRAEAALESGSEHGSVADDLRAAHAGAEALGAAPLAAAVAALAERAGVRLAGAPEPRATDSDQLTPRERSVLALVAGGRTNRQVGAELFISEKTVSVHLSRVMAKLGASSRTEAVSVAYERGLLAPADHRTAPANP